MEKIRFTRSEQWLNGARYVCDHDSDVDMSGEYYRAYDVEKRVADMIDARNGAIEELKKRIAELEAELLRLREIVGLDKEKAFAKAAAGICEGCCEEHRGKTHAVRVWGKGDYDWGVVFVLRGGSYGGCEKPGHGVGVCER